MDELISVLDENNEVYCIMCSWKILLEKKIFNLVFNMRS